MRRFLFLIVAVFASLTMSAANKSSKELAKFIRAMVEEERIHPDSLYSGIVKLERQKDALTSPSEKAVCRAVLGYLYDHYADTANSIRYQSDSDTTMMRAWSYDDFRNMAGRRYSEALADMELLHKEKISSWAPLVDKGRDDAIYNNDMLMLVWSMARRTYYKASFPIPTWKDLMALYQKEGNRKAVLLLQLNNEYVTDSDKRRAAYKQLINDFGDLDICAEVYLRLAQMEHADSLTEKWLVEGLKKYSHYKYKARLQNELQKLQAPLLNGELSSDSPYPGKSYNWYMDVRNIQDADMLFYRLDDTFDNHEYASIGKKKQALKYLLKHARKVDERHLHYTGHPAWQIHHDTISWTAPEVGNYVLITQSRTPMKLAEKVQPSVRFFYVSRLVTSHISLPGGIERVMVHDAITGKPVEGAEVQLVYKKEGKPTELVMESKTDSEGKWDIVWPKTTRGDHRSGLSVTVKHGDDKALPSTGLYYGTSYFTDNREIRTCINVYTDRSIYRPGQVVHMGGVKVYQSDWDEDVEADSKVKVTLYNANGKAIDEQSLTTDSMGVFSADFTLPETGVTGQFRIAVSGSYNHYFRVEEYKRPTFEVLTDEAPAVQMPVDSITLTGRAMMYNGAPVRGASVAAQYRWESSWWRLGQSGRNRYDEKSDTVLTDENGCFKVTIPVKQSTAELRYGKSLIVHYDVVSPSGETHTAQHSLYMSSSPLSIYANVPRMVDRDKLSPWNMTLLSSTGTEVQGDVRIMLKKGGKVCFETKEKSGGSVMPNSMKDAPSGRYDLHLEAVLKGDTARYKSQVVIFSQHDTKLPTDSTLWVYVPERNMSESSPARIQIGSSKDVYLRYLVCSNKEVVTDRLIHLNDSVMTFDIPYEERFDKTLSVNVMLVKDEKMQAQKVEILLAQPDKALKHRWITFRDKLQPGQKETWQLQLLTPDGKPASANLMASLYDASLDAIYSHNWFYNHSLGYHVYPNSYRVLISQRTPYANNSFSLIEYDDRTLDFAKFKSDLFDWHSYGSVKNFRKVKSSMKYALIGGGAVAGGGSIAPLVATRSESALVVHERTTSYAAKSAGASDFEELGANSADEALQGRIAGLDVVNVEGESDNAGDPVVQLRENFNETAFFYPALRTNEKGEVTLSFTLPESLTTWRMLGLAHTQNMLTTLLDEKVVAQKDLMAQLSLPRFLRQGDKATLAATLFNISEAAQKGRAVLTVLDAASEKVMLKKNVNFDLKAKSDSVFIVPFTVPGDATMLIVRWAAEGSTCSDGEQRYLPVLSNKEWITETKPLTYTKAGTYKEDMSSMFAVMGATNKQLTIEYVSQPVWYAVQALPSLAWPKDNDALSLATAYYAGSLSAHIASKAPVVADAIESWKENGMLNKSKLLQNEDLKNILLEETPWIALAEQETEKIQRLSTLFDEATQNSLQKEYLDKLRKLQGSDGSFSWYPGMKGNYYMTREVAYILTRLKVLTGKTPDSMLQSAINYIRKDRPTYLGLSSLRYLYVLYQSGVTMDKDDRHNADSLLKVLAKHPENLDIEERALAAIVLKKAGKDKASERYLETVKQFLVTNKEGLTYFEFPQGSHRSINRKLHIHVQVMEALAQLSPKDKALLDGMRRYLLRHKRTSEWDTPVNSANAVYMLLHDNYDALQQECDAEISLVQSKRKTKVESEGTSFGFFHERIDVDGPVATVEIKKTGEQESWGGIYAQYLAPLADISATEKGDLKVKVELQMGKDVGKQSTLQSGKQMTLQAGNRVHVRYVVTAEKDFEYVSVHAPRPATAEPVSQLSGYRWSNGLGYYRAVKDAAVNYFFDYLPRGTYVLEEDWLVEREGVYSTGITTIQCLYAPEFSAHTSDTRIVVREK